MITLKTDTYYLNSFGMRFSTEEEARSDEELRLTRDWKVDRIIGTFYEHEQSVGIQAIDDTKHPFTGQPDGICTVYLFKDMIKTMQAFVDVHGDMVGYTNHHCGMGHNSREAVIIKPNPKTLIPMAAPEGVKVVQEHVFPFGDCNVMTTFEPSKDAAGEAQT